MVDNKIIYCDSIQIASLPNSKKGFLYNIDLESKNNVQDKVSKLSVVKLKGFSGYLYTIDLEYTAINRSPMDSSQIYLQIVEKHINQLANKISQRLSEEHEFSQSFSQLNKSIDSNLLSTLSGLKIKIAQQFSKISFSFSKMDEHSLVNILDGFSFIEQVPKFTNPITKQIDRSVNESYIDNSVNLPLATTP